MSIQYCRSYTLELLSGVHDFSSDTIKLALYDGNASFGADTSAYTTSNELASGSGYTTGGATLAPASGYPQLENNIASVRFGVPAATWTFTDPKQVSWALMYNSDKANRAIMSVFIGNNRTFHGQFDITFPLSLDPILQIRAGGTS